MTSYVLNCARSTVAPRSNSMQKKLLLGAAAIALAASPSAYANPAGGTVTSGSATISRPSSNATTVHQTSEGVVIDWSSFDIGAGQTTTFVQPNAQAIAVDRIGGANASQILGTLDANGRVVLINGNGLLIGKGAHVNVGSLIATSTDGSDSDLLSGKFTQAGRQNASVINDGAIAAASGGVVALVAPNVSNTGMVNAKLGTVALGAANKFTVDFAGDGLVSFAAQGDVNARASAANSGTLSGANVSMTAHAADGIATGVVNMSGIVIAQGARNVGGTIYLNAGSGTLTTTGILDAAGATGGGHIETSGHVANIAGRITAGKGGLWKVDPEDLTIDSTAAATIDGALNGGTSVLEQTTSGAATGSGNQSAGQGDINVESALSWNTTATLTLNSYHSINIDAPITIAGAGALTLVTNDNGGSGGNYFFDGGNVAYTDVVSGNTLGALTINGTSYELVNSVAQLASVANANSSANIAFANSYNATPDGTYSNSPVTTIFGGSFEGLGNTISNLSVQSSGSDVGLFGHVTGSGTFSNISLTNLNISGQYNTAGFIGYSDYDATIRNVSVTGTITTLDDENGGLVGTDGGGTIVNSHTDVAISGHSWIGGLVGNMGGAIINSYATGSVYASFQAPGGLVGYLNGSITGSYSTGTVTANTYDAGGLVGDFEGGATILNSYSLARVSNGGQSAGGLVGAVEEGVNTITDSWAAGYVTAGGGDAGGLVGGIYGGSLTVTNSYWDKSTTGQTTSANSPNANGLTTSDLQVSLQTGLNDGAFAIVAGVTYPYLTWQVPSGTPQVVAGTVYAPNGTTTEAAQDVSLLVSGSDATPLAAMGSGADGYYYLLLAPNTIAGAGKKERAGVPGSPVFAYLTSGTDGASFVGSAVGGDSNLKIVEGELRVKSGASSVTGLAQALLSAVGGDTALLQTVFGSDSNANFFLDNSAANFNINSPINTGTGTFWLYDPNGAVSESGSGTITAGLLRGTSENGVTLNGANDITRLGQFTNTGGGGFSLTNSDTLQVVGAVNAGTGDLSLITTANGIALDNDLTAGGTVDLEAGTGIWQKPRSSVITAKTLTGSSNATTRLRGANLITDIGDFTVNDANFLLRNDQTLTVTGTVDANTIVLSATTGDLVNSGALHGNVAYLSSSQGEVYGTGNITAAVLNVTADTGIDLDGTTNSIAHVETDETNSGPDVINTSPQ